MFLTMIPVNSSAIRAVGYDGYTLTVEFHSGRICDHPGVPHSVYVEFMNARPPTLITTVTFAVATAEKIMSITRIGKIGRLPKSIRDDLGRRIEDGEPGKELVKWLNGLSGVQRVLKEQFGGRAVTEQNLSEWKQGGHPEWLRQEETRSLVSKLTEQSDDLDEAADGQEISDRYASVLAVELIRQAMTRLEKETDPEKRWLIICEVHRELS
jgi:hypothetical protein